MAFISSGGIVVSFCDYDDVVERDQRITEANEIVFAPFNDLEELVESFSQRSTQKIIYEIKDTDWWKSYFILKDQGQTNVSTLSYIDVPVPTTNKFIARQQDWTDLCVYKTLYEYLLPKVADFSNEDSAEVKKIGFYREKYQSLFRTLIDAGDWYDFDSSGAITPTEKMPTNLNIRRVR
jgi:predicted RNA-binding protein